jgi:hypothetical protein
MHELAVGQDTQNSWPVGITGFGLGVTDQPGTEALAGSAAAAATAIAVSRADIVAAIRRLVHHFMITPAVHVAAYSVAASLVPGRFKNASMPFDLRI